MAAVVLILALLLSSVSFLYGNVKGKEDKMMDLRKMPPPPAHVYPVTTVNGK